VTIYVIVRPDAKKFLEEMKNYYEVIIFTASLKEVKINAHSKLKKVC